MADEDEENLHRSEKHELINGLKSIIEGLLATHTTNVWNTYGGLSKVCSQVEKILHHGLKSTQGSFGSQLDYWPFVQRLKILNPFLKSSIERIGRNNHAGTDSKVQGHMWVKESLSEHNLSAQLITLTSDRNHLRKYYFDYAFLASQVYFHSMVICLQAVEQNKVALLAELDLGLLQKGRISCAPLKRSESLPVQFLSGCQRYPDQPRSMTMAPPFASPKKESILCTSDEHAVPSNCGSSGSPLANKTLARDALRTVLRKSGSESPTDVKQDDGFSFYNSPNSDPLRNIDFNTENNDPFTDSSDGQQGSQSKSVLHSSKDTSSSVSQSDQSMQKVPIKNSDMNENKVKDIKNVVKKKCKPEEIFSDSESRQTTTEAMGEQKNGAGGGKKLGHKRSRSDIGVKNVTQSEAKGKRNSVQSPEIMTVDNQIDTSPRDGYLPRPLQGQSLIHYLSSQDFNTCANLDKENAHFSISEALIAAIEQMKWNHVISPHTAADDEEEESDEEIKVLQQRIRIRKRERMKEKARGFPAFSDGRTDTASQSTPSPLSSSYESSAAEDSADSSEIEDEQIDFTMSQSTNENSSNLSLMSSEGLSLSLASLYSDADIRKQNSTIQRQSSHFDGVISHSAESVAISLLKKFSEKQLPKASDLQWLVSERDAPQKLLPLPNSYPVSPDDGENKEIMMSGSYKKMRIRGNLDWAPPRPQIIFNIHPTPQRNVIMAKQNYMCAGCGTRVEQGYMRRFRYCEYLGKYFCQCCHSNSLSHIPSRILRRWDFKKYYVSNFSKDLIMKIVNEPLFNLKDINSNLYRRVRALEYIRDLRIQTKHLKNFLLICKQASTLLSEVNRLPAHWSNDVQTYTLSDFLQVKNGQMLTQMRNVVYSAIDHVNECPFCQGMGFICELCQNKDVIFPFELQKVTQCPLCRACFHKQCYVPEKCPKCARIEARRLRQEKEIEDDEEEKPDVT